ncbi:hypothetical protein BU26DRAFT_568823 [Trematosphaeria pertusa]|uniref:Uncharacterized protein n=1 Tax=Trematosphaeria pertusa TaxID=390896 RepID=A0A6A6I494_9PLEO|nr:uncharacterized protein BU26DRAFT_568823 [Trematosphaeria pertusa]KAF2244828.1 hypothetical protein BU26DRAFT_568823 [Trematosphaeria pertusa]
MSDLNEKGFAASLRQDMNTVTDNPSATHTGLNVPRLLQLPAELRNHIYEYVLTAPDGLQYERRKIWAEPPKTFLCLPKFASEAIEFNQLKYVNRQLYNETAGLELKFNPIAFPSWLDEDLPPPGCQFLLFMGRLDTPKRSILRTIILLPETIWGECSIHEDAEDLVKINDFCKENPHATVKYICSGFSYVEQPFDNIQNISTGNFFAAATILLWVFRKQELQLPFSASPWEDELRLAKRCSLRHMSKCEAFVENFRVFPPTTDFDDVFVDTCRQEYHAPVMTRDDVDFLLAQARKWMESGL